MIELIKLELKDLEKYHYWKLPFHKYHDFNGPYFTKRTEKEVDIFIEKTKKELLKNILDSKSKLITKNDKIIGEVSWYWKSEETNWLEIGIVIFDEKYWNKGIGFIALKKWITYLFASKKEIVRLGFTTWSGNIGMMKLAEKLKFKKEAQYRKARIVKGKYYDSVSYGILREEWEA